MRVFVLASLGALACQSPAFARPLTPADLQSLSRMSAPAASPDGRWVAWQQNDVDVVANRGRYDIWRLDLATPGARPERIAGDQEANETAPAYAPDGALWFLSDQGGADAVWRIAPGTRKAVRVTAAGLGIAGFSLSPDGGKLLVWADRPVGARSLAERAAAPDREAGSGRAYDQLFVRHWDSWSDGMRSQLFVLPIVKGRAAGDGVPLVGALVGDAPSKPFGGNDELTWSADGRTIYFTLREAGRIEPRSTNLDIFAVQADGSATPVNLTDANDATDTLPAVSPDGRLLAYVAMQRPGYESDRQALMLRDLATGETRTLAPGWDRSVDSLVWAPNSASLYVTARDHFDRPLFQVDVATGKVRRLTEDGSVGGAVVAGSRIAYTFDSLTAPADLFVLDEYGASTRLTAINAAKLAGIDMPTAERFSFKGAAGDTIWAYAVRPAGLSGKAPLAYLIHGGPQGTFGNTWSYRWNPAVFAGAGYGAVMVDFHGSTGYGQAFTDSINRDWGGKPLADLKLGLAAAFARFEWLDGDRACALGGSYGGYMVNWIAGQWPEGFDCLVNHAGVFDARAMAYETEELWFDEWEHGGPYYEQAEQYERWNPVKHVAKWRTPMLVIHGEKDFRIPYTQGLAAFTALQARDIPSRLIIYPDENHWILKPKNSLQWYREVIGWLDKWTAPATKSPE